MLITDPRRDDNPIVFANAAFARLTGYDRGEIIGLNCRFLQGPETNRAEVARLRAAIEALEPIELELLNYKKDATTFWNRLLVSPVFDEDGRVLDAVSAGAAGFMLKDEDPHRIIAAVRQVAAGDAAFSPRAAKQLASWVRDSHGAEQRRDAIEKMRMLTERERDYAMAVTNGASDAELAQQFYVAETTIKSALAGIRTKWGVRTRTELAVVVARSGA